MKITDVITEAASPAQQAAIAISMKKAGKKPRSVDEDLTRRGFLRGLGAAAVAGAAGSALAGTDDPNFVRKVHDQHNAMMEKNPRYAKEHDALGIYIARGIVGASAENNKRWVEKTAQLLQKYGVKVNEGVAEGKIKLSTDPNWYGAEVDDYKASGPIVNIPATRLVGFEPDDKMNQPASKDNVEKIVAGLKQGAKLPPLMVRQYKNGYQVLDGHHRFWAYKLLGIKSIPAQIVPDSDIEEISKQGVAEGFFDSFKKKEVSQPDESPFQPIIDLGSVFSYIKISHNNGQVSFGLKTNTTQESKFALEEVKLLRKTIQSVKKDIKSQMSEFRQAQGDRVANRGAMIPGGGKVGTILRYAIRASRAAERGNASSSLKAVQDTVIAPLDKMLLFCDKFEIHLKKEIISGNIDEGTEQGVAEGSESDAYGNTGEKHECGSCDGTGIDTHDDVCPECGGKGWVRDKESSKKKDMAEHTELAKEFDLIESIVEMIAEHNGVDADVVWADLESLTEDELYVFAVTSDPLMEDWQKANKRDKTDGMSQKAVNAYRRENPGSKLKTAVTTKPSKLKKGGKASKRRKSYCSRSRGQMKMHSISCAKTPDKAICKARRRWNC